MRILESKKLVLKPVEEEDLQFLLDLRWDRDTMDYLIHYPISYKSQQQWLENIRKSGDMPLSIFVKENDELKIAGTVGLYEFDYRHQRANWRLRVSQTYRRKGIGFESTYLMLDYGFNTLNINKIVSDSFADNIAIVKLSKKLGFIEEGVLRRHYFHHGSFRDVIAFGLFREDFNKKNLINNFI